MQYKNKNGFTKINNKIVTSKNKNHPYTNKNNSIEILFPSHLQNGLLMKEADTYFNIFCNFDISNFSKAKLKKYVNIYGDKTTSICYESNDFDMYFYCTNLGINLEIINKTEKTQLDLSFNLVTSADNYENKDNGYIVFKSNNSNSAIIQTPTIKNYEDNKLKLQKNNNIICNSNNNFTVNFNIKNKLNIKDKIILSFDLYKDKIPDSSIYSKVKQNQYLSNLALIGKNDFVGEGIHFSRLRLQSILYIKPEDIINVTYYIKTLETYNENYNISMYENTIQWSSTNILWDSKKLSNKFISKNTTHNLDYFKFDITNYIKSCFEYDNFDKESLGFYLKGDDGGYAVLATSDNSLHAPYLKLTLKKPPIYFNKDKKIN